MILLLSLFGDYFYCECHGEINWPDRICYKCAMKVNEEWSLCLHCKLPNREHEISTLKELAWLAFNPENANDNDYYKWIKNIPANHNQ
jgi:hypothetical protein